MIGEANRRLNNVLDSTIKKSAKPDTFWAALLAFLYAVNWFEYWLLSLFGFHLCIITVAIIFRKSWKVQCGIIIVAFALIINAKFLNTLGKTHWKKFSTQNYFDPNGFFISMVLSLPLITISFFVLIYGLYQVSELLIIVKRH